MVSMLGYFLLGFVIGFIIMQLIIVGFDLLGRRG